MLKTRNYAVVLGIIAVSALGGALAYSIQGIFSGGQVALVAFSESTPGSFSATIKEQSTVSREDRLANMRKQIASKKNLFAHATTDTPKVIPEFTSTTSSEVTTEEEGEQRCVTYSVANLAWSSVGVKMEEVEGARLVYKEGAPTMIGSTSIPTRNTLAQLPLRSAPFAKSTCIPSDVIGISINGALMRNNEVSAYAGFGALAGYALDGFPIYGGAHTGVVDACGGEIVGGKYRYFVGTEQETIVNCYSGTPIRL